MKYLIIALLWAGYCVLHSFLISIWFTTLMARLLKSYYIYYRLFYVLISLVLLFPLFEYSALMNDKVILTYGILLSIIRYTLIAGSLLIFFYAFFFNYDALSFFGIRQILNTAKAKGSDPPEKIKKNGLLGIVRHPMYFALIIYLWCQTFSVSDIVVNVILTIYIIIGTRLEEKKLVMELGETYIRYQHEVPMLIPLMSRKIK